MQLNDQCTSYQMEDPGSDRIRILQLGSPKGLYGAERWILALIKHLDRNKFDIHVAAFQDDSSLEVPLCTEAARLGFRTHIFKVPGRFNRSALSELRVYIETQDINILHTHVYKQDIIGLLAARGTDCKVVSTPHGWSKGPDLKLWCYEMLNRAVFPFFDAVVPLSHDLYLPLTRLPGLKDKLRLIRNGVDISEIDSANDLAPEIFSLKSSGTFIIGYIGQLIHRKGLDVLLDALSRLSNSFKWHLLVVGEGSVGNSLQEKAKTLKINGHISFLGFRADRLSLLKGFDVFVLPSRLEGIPRCLMESMAAGIPVIASDIPGCNDLIESGKTGFLFEPENPDKLASAIEHAASISKHDIDTLKSNARGLVEDKFSANRMAKEYQLLFNDLLMNR